MHTIDTKKFVGLPWKFNGRDFDGVDCLGLLYLYFRENNWPETFDDGKPIEKDWFEHEKYRLYRYLLSTFDKIEDKANVKPNDILLMSINGESHTAILLPYNKILSTFPPKNNFISSCSFIDRFQYWERFFVCAFRRKE